MFRKGLAIIVLAVMLVTLAGVPAMAQAATQDPMTVSIMFSDHPSQPYQADTWLLPKVMLEKFNITLDMQAIPSASYEEKRNITLSSGDLPDIIMGIDRSVANEYGQKGMFLNIMNYSSEMPGLLEALESYPLIKQTMVSEDQMYALPAQITSMGGVNTAGSFILMARKDIMDQLGIAAPTTYDEFYAMLEAMKAAYPDSYPLINRQTIDFIFSVLAPSLGIESFPAGPNGTGWAAFDEASGTFHSALTEENFKYFIEFMKKCYDNGLLDPNYATDDTATWEGKIVSGQGFVAFDWFARPEMMNNIALSGGTQGYKLAAILPPAKEAGEKQSLYAKLGIGGYNVVSAKTANPERLAQMLDYWMFSEEGCMLTTMGIEGETYTVNDDNTLSRTFTDTIKVNLDFDAAYGTNYLTFWTFLPDHFGYDMYDANASADFNDTWNLVKSAMIPAPPTVIFNDEETVAYSDYQVDLQDTVRSTLNQFIMGQRDMSEWDAALAEVDDAGMTDFIDLLNGAYARING